MSAKTEAEIFLLERSHTICNAQKLRAGLGDALSDRRSLKLDASLVEQADLTFVQVLVSASRSFAASGVPFSIVSASDQAYAAFSRAGVTLPGSSDRSYGEGVGNGHDPHRR